MEEQIAKHSGIRYDWEYNLLRAARRHRLPWSGKLKSTLGLSHASNARRAEATLVNSGSEKLPACWHLELTLDPPQCNWRATLRMLHRSTAYCLFGSDGGSNAVALGLRYESD